jgi:flagellar assembly protein FliH
MTAAKNFTFGSDFSAEENHGPTAQEIEHDQIRTAAYEEGYAAGLTAIEHQCDELLQNILHQVQTIEGRHNEQLEMMQKQAASLAHSIIKKLAPALVENTPLDEIELLVQQCLKNNPLEPRIMIYLNEALIEQMTARIEKIQEQSGFEGKIKLISENTPLMSDCRVEWDDGGAERDFEGLMATIDSTVQLFIDAPVSPEA